jgi:predicted dehydrogenase
VPSVRAWENFDAALEESGAQAWVVATRTDTHVPLAEKILGRGLSALVEKPLAPDVPTARKLEKLVRADSSNLMLGHIVLFASKYRLLMAEAKKRGAIKYFHAFRHRPAWMNQKFAEETPLRFTMVHDLYMALALTDAQEPKRMSARMRPRADGSGFDLAMAEIEWPNGTWGSFTASFLTPDGMPEDGFDRFEIFGDGWAARLASRRATSATSSASASPASVRACIAPKLPTPTTPIFTDFRSNSAMFTVARATSPFESRYSGECMGRLPMPL